MFRAAVYIITPIAILAAYVKYLESNGIFFPVKDVRFSPASIKLPFEDVYMETKDNIRINGWFIPSDNARYTILFCHGNGGNVGDRLDKVDLLQSIGVNIFIIDYRGYGRSQGRPSEFGLYLDAEAGYDYLINNRRIKPENIILYGESLGSAVAINLASKAKVLALILEGAFSKGRDMAKKVYPFLPAFFFSNKFDSLRKIKAVESPILFIHSKNDQIVPFPLSEKLYNAANEPKRFVEVAGDHNSGFLDSKQVFLSSIKSFIGKL